MKEQLSFREIHENDLLGLSEIEQLAREIWSEYYTSMIGKAQVAYMLDNLQSSSAVCSQIREGYRYFLVEWERKYVGYFAVQLLDHDSHKEMFLSKLYVLLSFRGHGVGQCSLGKVEALARDASVTKLSLMVNKGNLSSIRFYERQGFLNCGPIVKDIGGGFVMDDFLFEKAVGGGHDREV